MSTFKFNFHGENEIDTKDQSDVANTTEWIESLNIKPKNQINELEETAIRAKMFTCGDVEIGHVLTSKTTSLIIDSQIDNAIKLAEEEDSDLVSGKYEGGLKIWECTNDLIQYIEEARTTFSFEGKKVLDLGCGAGILGIYAYMNGSSKVTFQDYNIEVIEHCTIPNVFLNTDEDMRESEIKKCQFYTGDWASFNEKCRDVFDIILTSETIYNGNNYEKLVNLFYDKLHDCGVIYVAAKTYYFGVGGGTRQFEQCLQNNGSLESTVCWKSSGGIQREIIKITKKLDKL